MHSELSTRTAKSLHMYAASPHPIKATVGLDGFVDEIIRVVDKRTSSSEYTVFERISDLASRIAAAAGQSANIELIVERVKLGGNGPIMANALAAVGADVTCVGPLGSPTVHPAFAEMASRATIVSVGNPGHTDALEFGDGKLMLGKLQTLDDLTWQQLTERIGLKKTTDLLTKSDLVALVNWTMIPAMSEIWECALELFESTGAAGRFFFDLADPDKRNDGDLLRACDLIARFQAYGPTILGLNEKEAIRVAHVLGYEGPVHTREHIGAAAAHISDALPIETVVVHPRAYALTASHGKVTSDVDGPFTDSPKISTGAGDHFNAGFCFGKLLGLPDDQATTVGVGTSGYYVRNAHSPSAAQLAAFLESQAKVVA
jgi:sugar/nucleoside kinase (ribokinase family)